MEERSKNVLLRVILILLANKNPKYLVNKAPS